MKIAAAFTLAALVAIPAFATPSVHNWQDIESYQKDITWLIESYTLAYQKKRTTPQMQALGQLVCELHFDSSRGEDTDTWKGIATGVCLNVDEEPRATVVVKVTVNNLSQRVPGKTNRNCSRDVLAALGLSLMLEGTCASGWKEYNATAEFTPITH